jgi:hypothetical protein
MARTRHFQQRMSQRGITLDIVDLTQQFGETQQDKVYLNRKGLLRLIENARKIERTAKKALDRGGIVVVENDGSLITTYRFDSYDRKKARRVSLRGRH